jgi:hypothetical protein
VSAPHRPGHVVTSDMVRFAACFLALPLATALWAQPRASSSSKPPSHAKSPFPEAGAISAGVYHNSTFGFSYKVPYGWVDRTGDMHDDSADASKSRLLLAVFERPPEATGDTINSAVVIAAEVLPAGLKTAAEYFESLSALTTAKGFARKEEPGEFSVGSTKLVRGDFSKARGTLAMHQVSLVTLQKGYAISFTFIGGSEDEVNELIEKLSFASRKRAR